MKVLVVLIIVFGVLGYLIYLSRKNQRLNDEIEAEKKAKEKQIEITKTYEKQQKKADEIKNRDKAVSKDEKDIESIVSSSNDAIASFNRVQDKSK